MAHSPAPLDRPAVQKLWAEVRECRIDIVLVYKVLKGLGDRHEGDAVEIEQLDQLGEIGERAGEPVDSLTEAAVLFLPQPPWPQPTPRFRGRKFVDPGNEHKY
jgi:hypothetical protein